MGCAFSLLTLPDLVLESVVVISDLFLDGCFFLLHAFVAVGHAGDRVRLCHVPASFRVLNALTASHIIAIHHHWVTVGTWHRRVIAHGFAPGSTEGQSGILSAGLDAPCRRVVGANSIIV